MSFLQSLKTDLVTKFQIEMFALVDDLALIVLIRFEFTMVITHVTIFTKEFE